VSVVLICFIQAPLLPSEDCVVDVKIVEHCCCPTVTTANEVCALRSAGSPTTSAPLFSTSARERHDVGEIIVCANGVCASCAGGNGVGSASDDNICVLSRTMARQDKCAARACERACERETACEHKTAYERETAYEHKTACERKAPFKGVVTEVDPFGSTNDASLPPGVATDFLLARMKRPPARQQRCDKALEKRTCITPVDVITPSE
jgi:hypothetical protein